MKIFKSFFKIIYSIGFILFLFLTSYIIVILNYYNHNVGDEIQEKTEMDKNDKIIDFSAKNYNYVSIEVKFSKKQNNEYLIAYATKYFEMYNKQIYLYDLTFPYTLVTIDLNGNGTIINT